jgi:hypothetical protein
LTVTNSIVTGENGYLRNSGTFISNWNDNDCTNRVGGGGSVTYGPNDINDVNPFYIQTSNPDDPNETFFKLQPYSPLIDADEFGSYLGSQGPMAGFEVYPADFDLDLDVDFKDFALFALKWREDNTIPAIPQSVQETFESFTATGAPGVVGTLLGPRVAGKPDAWRVVPYTTVLGSNWYLYNDPWRRGSSTLSLLTDANDANSPHQAMRWVYDVNNVSPTPPPGDQNGVRYTEILVILPAEVNLAAYNEVRVMLKRHAGNSPDTETFMYVKLLNDIYGTYGKGGIDKTGPDKRDIANSVIGGSTSVRPGEYYDWTINLDKLVGWTWTHTNLQHVGGIIFGIQSQPLGPYGKGTGTIDVDDIRLVDRPSCTPFVEDLTGDCRVDFNDVREFVKYWLEGT